MGQGWALVAIALFLEYVCVVVVVSLAMTGTGAGPVVAAVLYAAGSLSAPVATARFTRRRGRSVSAIVTWAAGASLTVNLVLAPFGLRVISI